MNNILQNLLVMPMSKKILFIHKFCVLVQFCVPKLIRDLINDGYWSLQEFGEAVHQKNINPKNLGKKNGLHCDFHG